MAARPPNKNGGPEHPAARVLRQHNPTMIVYFSAVVVLASLCKLFFLKASLLACTCRSWTILNLPSRRDTSCVLPLNARASIGGRRTESDVKRAYRHRVVGPKRRASMNDGTVNRRHLHESTVFFGKRKQQRSVRLSRRYGRPRHTCTWTIVRGGRNWTCHLPLSLPRTHHTSS